MSAYVTTLSHLHGKTLLLYGKSYAVSEEGRVGDVLTAHEAWFDVQSVWRREPDEEPEEPKGPATAAPSPHGKRKKGRR